MRRFKKWCCHRFKKWRIERKVRKFLRANKCFLPLYGAMKIIHPDDPDVLKLGAWNEDKNVVLRTVEEVLEDEQL